MNITCGKKSTRRSSFTFFMFGKVCDEDEINSDWKGDVYKELLQACGIIAQSLYTEANAYHVGAAAIGILVLFY